MTYFSYVIGAYAVFVIVLAWDYVVPRLQIRHELRTVRLRKAREAKRSEPLELTR